MSVGFNVDGSSLPQGFLPCHGDEISRTEYKELYSVIGNSWGSGDGQTTFNLPYFNGLFLRGVSDGTGKDPNANSRQSIKNGGNSGDNVGSIQTYATAIPKNSSLSTSENGSHNHDVEHLPNDSSWYKIAGSHYAQWNNDGTNTSTNGKHSHTISSGGDTETRPVNVYVDYIIYCGI